MYKLFKSELTKNIVSVIKTDGNNVLVVPFDPDNTDYQQYLKWVEAGNTPLPADGE